MSRKTYVRVDQDAYLGALREVDSGELEDFADLFDVHPITARRKLDGLVAQGKAQRLPARGRGPLYRIAPSDEGKAPATAGQQSTPERGGAS